MIVNLSRRHHDTLVRWHKKVTFVYPPLDTPNGYYKVTATPGSKYLLTRQSDHLRLCSLTDFAHEVMVCYDVALELFGCLKGSFDIKLEKL